MHGGLAFFLSVVRIETTFESDVDRPRPGHGTAFFVKGRNGHAYLVTNKHNVSNLKLGSNYRLTKLGVHVRRIEGELAYPKTVVHEFPLDDRHMPLHHKTSDVSIYDTHDLGLPEGHKINAIDEDDVADQRAHAILQPMDFVSFVGFPGKLGSPWIDKRWNTPIARLAAISSMPGVPFVSDAITTSDVTLVNGLSFEGSSGSLVVSHPRDESVIGRESVPTKVVGIMSGGWPGAFGEHKGISYYTRSTSILELLDQAVSGQ